MSLPIFFEDLLVGELDTGPRGTFLRYATTWLERRDAFPISLAMPLSEDLYGPEAVVPWLMNLLPEGQPLRAMAQVLGVSREDVMSLIAQSGRDLAGALRIGKPRSNLAPDLIPIPGPVDLERIIDELPAKPFLVGEEGVSMSLTGAQEKLPLARSGTDLAIPVNGAASTLILKPDNPRLAGSVQNEALCMVLARRCGLSTARVTTGVAGKRSYLLVDRYDRMQRDERVIRIHQEDFCQALGRSPASKYQHNQTGAPGPSLAELFSVTDLFMTARDTNRLLEAVIFNIAIGNVDSHAKNYSILLTPDLVELAPLYDLMSGLIWRGVTENHAQDIGGQARGRHIHGRNWIRMAEASGISGTATVRRVTQVTSRILAELPSAVAEVGIMQAGPAFLDAFATAIAERATIVRRNASIEIGPESDSVLG
jgi:serine/threonine-protein kinase HipA